MMIGKNPSSGEVAKRIEPGSRGAEIGVWRGDTSEVLLKRVGPGGFVHLVDPWSVEAYGENFDQGDFYERYANLVGDNTPEAFQRYYDKLHKAVRTRFRDHPNCTIWRMDSQEFFDVRYGKHLAGGLDWVYIDGDHTFEGCLADLHGCLKVLKDDALILGDDFGNKPGVERAVIEFCDSTGREYEIFSDNQYAIPVQP